MSSNHRTDRHDRIAAEAADWFVEMQGADVDTNVEFAAWLKASPEHIREYLEIAAIWSELPKLRSQPIAKQLAAVAKANTLPNVLAIFEAVTRETKEPNSPTQGFRHWWVAATTGLAAALIAAVIIFAPSQDKNLINTAIGEQMSFPLPDGSIVTLNTQSTVRLQYSEHYRDVILLSGEALFEVAKDTGRPFRVLTDWALIEAVGTQFNVRYSQANVTVTVVEGTIEVAPLKPSEMPKTIAIRGTATRGGGVTLPTRVTVGRQAHVNRKTGDIAVIDADIEIAMAWQERRLVFESLSLGDVIDEFNRYNDPPLLIADRNLMRLPISGVFQSNDRSSFVQFLEQMKLAETQTLSDGTIVLRKSASDPE